MREEQKLYPQLIYRINNALSELKTEFKDDLFIAPSVLNPYSRTFNWLLVAEGRWNLSNGLMSEIQNKIENSKKEWNQFKEEFKKIKEVKSVANAIRSIENSENLKPEEYYSVLLFLYQSYPINNKEYFDGIIYQNLIKRAKTSDGKNHRIDYAEAELLIKKRKNNELYPPVDIVFYYGKRKEPKKALSQVINNTKDSNNNFHKNYLLPFFGKYENTFDPKTFLVLKPEHFSKFRFLYIIPFYDALYGQYGNICGILTIFFSEPGKRKSFIKSKANKKLIARLSSYVEEIKRAALFEILKQPIETETDLLEHFIKYLPMLQDWEFIRVFGTEDGDKVILAYCYGREENNLWKRCKRKDSDCENRCGIPIDKNNNRLKNNELEKKILDDKRKYIAIDEISFGIGHKYKALLEDVFTERYIPELDEYDKALCKDKIVIYEYPPYTIFPDDEPKEHTLGLYYERQQIDLLRQLAIKRKVILETIRHGTRAAVAAIMGRNMSHNIGSHVLSYWKNELEREDYRLCEFFSRFIKCFKEFRTLVSSTSEITEIQSFLNELNINTEGQNLASKFSEIAATKKENNNSLERSYLLFDYLKNRMDFIAEITTTPPSWEKSILLNNEIIQPFCKQKAILNNLIKSEGFCYIFEQDCQKLKNNNQSCSGCKIFESRWEKVKNNGKANFENEPEPFSIYYDRKTDFSVSIPHGVIGVHAIYSILENFIRNSAKHGGRMVRKRLKEQRTKPNNGKDYFKITVKAEDNKDFVAVTVMDNVGNCDIKVKNSEGKEKRIIEHLNDAIQDSKYVDNEGGLLKGNWGIKEIKLSANFLRMKNTDTLVYSTRIDEDGINYPIVQLKCYEDNCKTNGSCTLASDKNIAYTFYLRKPKEAFIVYSKEDDSEIKEILNKKDEHRKNGIDMTNFDDFKSILERGENIPHRFIIFMTSELFDKFSKLNLKLKKDDKSYTEIYSTRLPGRVIVNNNGRGEKTSRNKRIKREVKTCVNINLLKKSESDKFMRHVYENYVKSKFLDSRKDTKIFFLPKNNGHNWGDDKICFTNNEPSKDSIVFDDHGESYNAEKIKEYTYYHPFGTTIGFTFNNFISRPPEGVKKNIAHYELIEMAKVKVVIADERIYKNYAGKKVAVKPDNKPDIIELMKEKMGVSIVSVPADTVDQNTILFDVNSGDFLVIHQGLIEKMTDKEDFLKRAKDTYAYIVIDSGRGVPERLEEGTLYIEIGALERFIDELDKYSLIQTLYSLRRPKNV